MSDINWKREMPDVPEVVHEAVLEALKKLDKAEDRIDMGTDGKENGGEERKYPVIQSRKGKHHRRKTLVVLAAALAAAFGMTVAAAGLLWNERAAEEFHNPAPSLQQETIESGVADIPDISVTDKGITVTAVQTLRDENRVYLLFKVSSEEAVIDGNSGFEGWRLYDGEITDIFGNMGAQFLCEETGELLTEGYYMIDAMNVIKEDWKGEKLSVCLSDFSYYTYESGDSEEGKSVQTAHHIDGVWEMEFPLENVENQTHHYEVGQKMELPEGSILVKSMEISPLSIEVVYDRADADKVFKARYGEEDGSLWELFTVKILDKEGNVMNEGVGGVSSANQGEDKIIMMELSGVIDTEEVGTIELGEKNLVFRP